MTQHLPVPQAAALSLWRGEIFTPLPLRQLIGLFKAEAAARYGVTVEEINGRSQVRPIAWARQEAMAATYHHTRLSMPQVGRIFGRDHTTVLHAIQRVAERAQKTVLAERVSHAGLAGLKAESFA